MTRMVGHVWVVGRLHPAAENEAPRLPDEPLPEIQNPWDLLGVFQTEEAARAACTHPNDFYAPAPLNRMTERPVIEGGKFPCIPSEAEVIDGEEVETEPGPEGTAEDVGAEPEDDV